MTEGGKQVRSCCGNFGNPTVKYDLRFMYKCSADNYCRETHDSGKVFFFCLFLHEKRNISPYYAGIRHCMDELCNESRIL
jgi:hypothetical protein